MRIKTLLLIVLLTLIIISGCTQAPEEPIKKTTGGVIICGINCPCGEADDVCPEDYGTECKVEDPDCE